MGTTAQEPMNPEENVELTTRAGEIPRCRICASSVEVAAAARIFAEDGIRRNLQKNIRKYLYITVSSEDKLPKIVCESCIHKLDGIHAFASMALRTQEKLKQEFIRGTAEFAVVDRFKNSSSSLNKIGDRGLLHSILTKGSIDSANDIESPQGRQRTPSTEEMEVKVDPMLFLQCALEQPPSADYSDFSEDSEKDVNFYSNPAPESISLMNKIREKIEKEYEIKNEIEKSRDNNDNEEFDNIEIMDDIKDNETDDEDELENIEDLSNAKLKQHACKICTKVFSSQITLQDHLWLHLQTTTNDMSYVEDTSILRNQSDYGGDNFVMSQNNGCLENSLLTGNFICPICGKRISTKGNLKVHLETHRPKGKYECDICGRIFKTHSNLFRHKEYHSGIQFPCGVCGRVYPTNSTLRAHSITHSDLRPHACPLCDKTFKRNQDLKFHINQHTGARPYQCPYCPKAFASSGNCFSHRKRMHPKEVHRDRQRAADLMR